jgi:hypothetical protein
LFRPSSTYTGKTRRYQVNLLFSPSYVLIVLPSYSYFNLIRFLLFLHLTKSTSDPIPSSFIVTSSQSLRGNVEDPVEKRYCSTSIEYPSIYPSLHFGNVCSPLWTYLKGGRVLCTFEYLPLLLFTLHIVHLLHYRCHLNAVFCLLLLLPPQAIAFWDFSLSWLPKLLHEL